MLVVLYFYLYRGDEFRTAFKSIADLGAYFPDTPIIGLSGSLTISLKKKLPSLLGITDYTLVEVNPYRCNIYLDIVKKPKGDVESIYEDILIPEIKQLAVSKDKYPVTLCYCNFKYMSLGLKYCKHEFGDVNVHNALFGALYNNQDEFVTSFITEQLKSSNPIPRFIFTTSVSGMGFDPKCITKIIHTAPPRNIIDYLQQIGRSGRSEGSQATAVLHWSPSDIMSSLPGIQSDIQDYCKANSCLWNCLLSNFGYTKPDGVLPHNCCVFCRKGCICDECVEMKMSQISCED